MLVQKDILRSIVDKVNTFYRGKTKINALKGKKLLNTKLYSFSKQRIPIADACQVVSATSICNRESSLYHFKTRYAH